MQNKDNMSFVFTRLRQLDAYSKPLEDFRIKTLTGGAVTLISAAIMVLLFVSEFRYYMKTDLEETLFVDTSSGEEKVKIAFDVIFPALPCPFVSVDAMDVSGEHQSDVSHNVWKKRLDKHGETILGDPHKIHVGTSKPDPNQPTTLKSCPSCYGAESEQRKCCETCDDVRRAYSEKGWALHDVERIEQCKGESWAKKWEEYEDEGCQVYGTIEVAKVGGNFHIAPGKTVTEKHAHVHDLHSMGPEKFNTSHKIIHFAFGETYPGKTFPLDGHFAVDQTEQYQQHEKNQAQKIKHTEFLSSFLKKEANEGGSMFQYYVKIVPTAYEYIGDVGAITTHQFSVTKHQKNVHQGLGDGLPGLFVLYEFSPLMVKLTEMQRSFTHFLTSVCAIIGGVFTVASLIDAFLYHGSRVLQQKIELGKAS